MILRNEHQDYAFSKVLLAARKRALVVDTIAGIAFVVVPAALAFWIAGAGAALVWGVLGAGAGQVVGLPLPVRNRN